MKKNDKAMQGNKKKFAIIGVVVSALTAGVKMRHLTAEAIDAQMGMPKSAFRFSKDNWKSVLGGVKNSLGEKRLSALAAGVAYYATLAFFPLLAATVAIAALLITPEQLESLIAVSRGYLPEDISDIIVTQLQNLVSRRSDNLLAATIATAVALYGASGVSKNLVVASNAVYGGKESRGWLIQQLTGVAWTIAGIVLGFVVLGLMAVNQSFLQGLRFPHEVIPALLYGRWVVVLLITISGVAIFYRYGPTRRLARWRWVVLSAAIATVVWLTATSLFFLYLQNFANYTQSYSLFAGIIALMVWMNLSALILLIGAELNHQIESVGRKGS